MTDDGSVKRYRTTNLTVDQPGYEFLVLVVLASDYDDLQERLIDAHERAAQLRIEVDRLRAILRHARQLLAEGADGS